MSLGACWSQIALRGGLEVRKCKWHVWVAQLRKYTVKSWGQREHYAEREAKSRKGLLVLL